MTPTPYHVFETALGFIGIAWNANGVRRLHLPAESRDATEQHMLSRLREPSPTTPPAPMERIVAMIRQYAQGHPADFSGVTLDLDGVTPLYRTIYEATRRIGWGETLTYAELAASAGFEGKAWEVGQAMGRNPVTLIIPCHRVLAAGNRIGGFSAPGGTQTKLQMLQLEGVDPTPPAPAQQSFNF
ncbi:MAG: methylated-DNA--[protein]-cysteine S-methyltransferase [Phyllobacterium sp.]